MVDVRWMWVFLDTIEADAARSWEFWREVTRSTLSPTRGDRGEFATLLPSRGEAWVKVQAVLQAAPGQAGGSVHLDLDVDDARRAAEEAKTLGAQEIGVLSEPDGRESVVILRSPGGFVFCFTTWDGTARHQVREGEPDLLDQVCLDLPEAQHDAEIAFWSGLTGWEWRPSDVPEFSFLQRPPGIPLRLLFQRLGEPIGQVCGHADLACVDRAATSAVHEDSGAQVVEQRAFWSVLRDPVGRVYCLTDRTPVQEWVGD